MQPTETKDLDVTEQEVTAVAVPLTRGLSAPLMDLSPLDRRIRTKGAHCAHNSGRRMDRSAQALCQCRNCVGQDIGAALVVLFSLAIVLAVLYCR